MILFTIIFIICLIYMSDLANFYPIQTGEKNKILRTKSREITVIDSDIIDFADDLLELMYEYDGVWLAAPQIGKNIRMIAITTRKEWKKWTELVSEWVMINPVILEASPDMVISEEACLSLPNLIWDVKRHKTITIEYKNIEWFKKKKKLKNYNAFIIQHEIDHLNWILFVDKIIPAKNGEKEKFE